MIKSERIVIPMFEIVSMPIIKIADVKQRRFNIIDRNLPLSNDVILIISGADNGNI